MEGNTKYHKDVDTDQLVFENGNNLSGTFYQRKTDNRNLTFALLICVIWVFSIFGIAWLVKLLSPDNEICGLQQAGVDISSDDRIYYMQPIPADVRSKPEVVSHPGNFTIAETLCDPLEQQNVLNREKFNENSKNKNDVGINLQTEYKQPEIQNFSSGMGFGLTGYAAVTQKPFFPGGEDEMIDYLTRNICYPDLAREYRIQGMVFIGFVVEKDGSLTDIRVERGIGAGCDEEALRVVKSMPTWIPAMQNSTYVRVRVQVPVKFIVAMKSA